ncbi:hypothetical protein MMC18_000579 [Xylographa bjoerkii]|nr:hypothetical protein [Xylographa bjoerkii]
MLPLSHFPLILQVLFSFQVAATAIEKRSSKSFAGANSYFVHAISTEYQTDYIEALAADGAKVIRLWVTGAYAGCTKGSTTVAIPDLEPNTVGTFNDAVLIALDNTLKIVHANGMKAIISPHDGNLLPPSGSSTGYNGCDVYCKKYGSSDTFYTSTEAKSDYDTRMAHILNYQSPNFGQAWSQLSEVILGFDLQNEPMIASVDLLENNDASDWLCGRAGNMKKIISTSGVKIATGGVGGSEYENHEYNIIEKVLYCSAIDILSVHGYMSSAGGWSPYIPSLEQTAAGQGKHLMVEEWGVKANGEFDPEAANFNSYGIPWASLSTFPLCLTCRQHLGSVREDYRNANGALALLGNHSKLR